MLTTVTWDDRNTTLEGNTGEKSFLGIVFTLNIIADNNGVGLSEITHIKSHILTADCYIVTITSNCV